MKAEKQQMILKYIKANIKVTLKMLLVFVILLFFNTRLISQSTWSCGTLPDTSNSAALATVAQPTGCIQLLNDFVPKSYDRSIEINVHIWIFYPAYMSSVTSVWTNSLGLSTYTDAVQCLQYTSNKLANLYATPNLTVAGVPASSTDAKIKFKLKALDYIQSTAAYMDLDHNASSWIDANAFNVYFGANSFTTTVTSGTTTYIASTYTNQIIASLGGSPSSRIIVNPSYFYTTYTNTSTGEVRIYDNIRNYGEILAHEFGHALGGLRHPTGSSTTPSSCCIPDPYSGVSSQFGCCSHILSNDYAMEHYACNTSTSGCEPAILQQPCSTLTASSNLMSHNSGCNMYLSPQQGAMLHFNARTLWKMRLSASGATDALTRDPAFDYTLTANETWEFTDRYFKGNVIVPNNVTLIIKCGVGMTKGAGIIVYPGGQLVIDGGLVTNISGQCWDGIYLYGNPNLAQLTANPYNSGALLNQGVLRIKNGGTISQAKIGVRNYYSGWSNSGGVILAQNANFKNNIMDVDFKGDYFPNTTPINNASWFYGCNFATTSTIGLNFAPTTHVNIYKTNGVVFKGCTFQYTVSSSSSGHGNGITSVDASYLVDQNGSTPNIFRNLQSGIIVNNINPLRVPSITNTKFIENQLYAGYFINANYLAFKSNTVQVGQYSNSEGIYLNTCKYYNIFNNTFSQANYYASPGVNIYRSKTGSHQVLRNTFSHLLMGVNCMDDNGNPNPSLQRDGLLINCNTFYQSPNIYDVVMSYTSGLALPTVRKIQGEINFSANSRNVVRNIYGAVCNGAQNKWQIYSAATQTVDHGSNSSSLTAVTQPPSNCKSLLLHVVGLNLILNYSADCPLTPLSSGGSSTVQSQRLADMNSYITTLKTDNPDGINNFEIQATVGSKLSTFLTDTLGNDGLDSVINILSNNHGNMEDADIQTVYAYMLKGNYTEAMNKINHLDAGRQQWKDFLTKLVTLEGDTTNGIYGANSPENRAFFYAYSTDYNKDGQAPSQALMKFVCDSNYTEPHALPEGEEGARMSNPFHEPVADKQITSNEAMISVFPNPTKSGVYVYYSSEFDGVVKMELRDLVGKLIYANFISTRSIDQFINMSDLNNGMYILTLTKNKVLIYKTKIVKQE